MLFYESVISIFAESFPREFFTESRKTSFRADFSKDRISITTDSIYKVSIKLDDFFAFIFRFEEKRNFIDYDYKSEFRNASYLIPIAFFVIEKLEVEGTFGFKKHDLSVKEPSAKYISSKSYHLLTRNKNLTDNYSMAFKVAPAQQEARIDIFEGDSRTLALVDVHFATNRKLIGFPKYFSQVRNDSIHYGKAVVLIPEGHDSGVVERPYEFMKIKCNERRGKHFFIDDVIHQEEEDFFKGVRSKSSDSSILVFIHGYNVSFKDAIFKTAQIKYDFCVDEPVILFSWPSLGKVKGYGFDRENALHSRDSLRHFLDKLSSLGYREVSVIAHSMGTFCLAEAIREKIDGVFGFSRLVLAAADIEIDNFRASYLQGMKNNFKQIALYVSSTDYALKISRAANNSIRVGDCSDKVAIFDGVETIDMSFRDGRFFYVRGGHSYYSESDRVLDDLHRFIRDGTPASGRRLQKINISDSKQYYKLIGKHY